MGKRKPVIVIGYLCTAFMGCFAFATSWIQVLEIRVIGWMGRGARGPVRDALLSESVPPEDHGKAFGFQSAMDTLGAIIGPLIALSLVGFWPLRRIFLIAFIPGAITVYIAIFILKDLPHQAQRSLRLWTSIRSVPSNYWVYLVAVGVFGLGNFAHTLLVFRAVKALTPRYGVVIARRAGIALYTFHNVLYAAVSYPAGVLGDRMDKRKLLAAGYALFGVMCLGFLAVDASLRGLVVLFALAGIYIGIVDGTERALAASLLPIERRNIGFGMLATVNSFGDLLSSMIVGFLWNRISFAWGFRYGGALTLAGAAALLFIPRPWPDARVSTP